MKEHPILFSAPMVQAILDGRKTQTRRTLKTQPLDVIPMKGDLRGIQWVALLRREPKPHGTVFGCRYGKPGDHLWVRETFFPHANPITGEPATYRATADKITSMIIESGAGWKPSIHMPRWASRITLEITGIRIERLEDISESDAIAEGIEPCPDSYRSGFAYTWDCINSKRGFPWGSKCWVWVIEFERGPE